MSLRQTTSRCLVLAGLSTLAVFAADVRTGPATRVALPASQARTSDSMSSASAGRAALASPVGAATLAAALPIDQAGSDPLTVEPRVPRAAGTPCVVELARDAHFTPVEDAVGHPYSPPAGCPGPWSKVRLVVDLTGPRPRGAPNGNIEISFFNGNFDAGPVGAGPLLIGAPQEHALIPEWRLERDLTEYAAMLTQPQLAYLLTTDDNSLGAWEDEFISVLARSVRLVFYPATNATPAPAIADAVYATTFPNTYPAAVPTPASLTLPRNIERVYLDVYAQALNNGGYFGVPGRFWYSCVPQAAAVAYPGLRSMIAIGDERLPEEISPDQGCIGGSYREVEVRIDGQLAGLAPLYPWLPSNIPPVVDEPAPSVQALNFVPYRVDLTPFAALLNNGAEHVVQTTIAAAEPAGPMFVRGQLLLYLDHGKALLTGALTRNTLAGHPAAPTVQDGLSLSNGTLQGSIVTTSKRQYLIEGYVDTSHGRIRSSVWQESQFGNTQTFFVQEPALNDPYRHEYRQNLRMSSTVQRISRRFLHGTLLSQDSGYVSYPLRLDYRAVGQYDDSCTQECFAYPDSFSVTLSQGRRVRGAHVRPGMPRYDTSLTDLFVASRQRIFPSGSDPDWNSARKYMFKDTLGSCYDAALATANGVLTSRTRGVACPNGLNHVRWFAHADGSPDGLGWAPREP